MDIKPYLGTKKTIISLKIKSHGYFPNNPIYPLLIYKKTLSLKKHSTWDVKNLLKRNGWHNSWTDSIYNYHHYHSNTHEALIILSGICNVQMGGPSGKIFEISSGDIIIIPAGVSHKNVDSSEDFKCVGAYPYKTDYNMKYGKANEHPQVDQQIKNVPLPQTDPVFGKQGPLFLYWKDKR